MSKLLAIDYDGTLAQYDGWKGEDHVGDILSGARQFLVSLKEQGFSLCIHTCRDAEQVKAWLKRYGLLQQIDFITRTKPPCFAYIDDRSIRFDGDFDKTLKEITDFRPWWQKEGMEIG